MDYFIDYWESIFISILSFIAFIIIKTYPNGWVLAGVLSLWLAVSFFVFYERYKNKVKGLKRYWITIALTIFGFVGVFLIVEWGSIRWLLVILASICMGALFMSPEKLEKSKESKVYEYKPWRRMFMMLVIFDSYLILTTLFGIDIFFSNLPIPFWVLALTASGIFVVSSVIIWQLYYNKPLRFFTLWALLVAVIIFELMWTAQFLPFGYLALGLLVTWMWYILQLFIRFHLSKRGIIWKKQKVFLISNIVFFVSFMYFIRWI